jgi:hypothetical protein
MTEASVTEASVVICARTFDRWNELNRAVGSVRPQTLAPHEIVVVVDNNEALRARAAREIAGVTVLANAKVPGLSGARMTGRNTRQRPSSPFSTPPPSPTRAGWRICWRPIGIRPCWGRPAVASVAALLVPRRIPLGRRLHLCRHAGAGRPHPQPPRNMSVRADVLRGAGGFPSDLGRRKLGFSVSGRARIGGKAEETEFSIRAARLFPGGYRAYRTGARMHHAVPTQRTTWKYFVHRCPVEGTAKAVLTCLAGSKDGLGAEGRTSARCCRAPSWTT